MSDSETSPEVNTGDVEGDVNVGTEAPAEESAPEGGDSEGGDDNASATDDASVDTGALQE